eukprot:COSAG01_NODE_17109_length_1178_cov_0.860982_2_plen_156_part_00
MRFCSRLGLFPSCAPLPVAPQVRCACEWGRTDARRLAVDRLFLATLADTQQAQVMQKDQQRLQGEEAAKQQASAAVAAKAAAQAAVHQHQQHQHKVSRGSRRTIRPGLTRPPVEVYHQYHQTKCLPHQHHQYHQYHQRYTLRPPDQGIPPVEDTI